MIKVSYLTKSDRVLVRELKSCYEVCWDCGGEGSHQTAWSQASSEDGFEFSESGPSLRRTACETCNGARVIQAVDEDSLNSSDVRFYHQHLRQLQDEEWLKKVDALQRAAEMGYY